MTTAEQKRKSKAGFTLIEIIAVLVILAVLAAVAIPRYINLIDEARTQALEGAVAAGLSHVSLAYGRLCLINSAEPTAAELAAEANANKPNSTDYSFDFASIAGGVSVTASEVGDATMTLTRNWSMP
jgi:MSHA pilin protein MshA